MFSKILNVLFWVALGFGFFVSLVTIGNMPEITGTGILATFIAALTIPGILYAIKFIVDKNGTDSNQPSLQDFNNSNTQKSESNNNTQKQNRDFFNTNTVSSYDPRFGYVSEEKTREFNSVVSNERDQGYNEDSLDPRFGYSIPEQVKVENKIEPLLEDDEDAKKIQLIEESVKSGLLNSDEAQRMIGEIMEQKTKADAERKKKEEYSIKLIQLEKLLESNLITKEDFNRKKQALAAISKDEGLKKLTLEEILEGISQAEHKETYHVEQGDLVIAKLGSVNDDQKPYVLLNGVLAPDGKYKLGPMWYIHVQYGRFISTSAF